MATDSHSSNQGSLLRDRNAPEAGKVSFVELFFDLVFVFAVTQLSHSLMAHFTPMGALQTLILMLAVWWVWIFTTWVTNWLNPEKIPVRLALLVLMLMGLVLSCSIPEAFESRGWIFAGAYVAMQVGRSLFFLWAVRGNAAMVENFQRILAWLLVGGGFWIAGAFAHGEYRIALWAGALIIEYLAPSMGFRVPGLGKSRTTDWDVMGGHIAERCGLFIIIALGESVLVTGATFSELVWTPAAMAAFVLSFVGSMAMWWIYFDVTAEHGSHTISHSRNPGRLARLAYTYLHLFMVAGIIVLAVSDEFVLHHPVGHSDLKTTVTILGGTALYLFGNLLFKRAITGKVSISHLVGIALMVALFPMSTHLPPLVLSTLSTLVLIGIAIADRRFFKKNS